MIDIEKLWRLAMPILQNNDFGVLHTQRVYDLAKENFDVKPQLQELTRAAIILHDIGGCTVKEQYEKGPAIAISLLRQLDCPEDFIEQVCEIISTHHDHPENPSEPFRALYDADKLAMFTAEEYPSYNSKEGFDWNKTINLIYTQKGRDLARKALYQRRTE